MIVSVFPSAFSILSLVFEQALDAQAVLGGGKVGNSFLHRRGIVAKHMQARAMGDNSDFGLHPFLVVVLINVFGVVEHVIQPFGIVEIEVKRDLAGPFPPWGLSEAIIFQWLKEFPWAEGYKSPGLGKRSFENARFGCASNKKPWERLLKV